MPRKFAALGLTRFSPFSFTCGRCSSCCKNQKIQVNPYECARMAACLNLSTTDFISTHTEKGVYLKRREDETCLFSEQKGCTIHPDRPMVCRLYPLGRNVSLDGQESFKVIDIPPYCKGKLSKKGTIQSYIESEGLLPFMQAADQYLTLFEKLALALKEAVLSGDTEALPDWLYVSPGADLQEPFPGLLDMDRVIRKQGTTGDSIPADPYDKMVLHIRLIEEWLTHKHKEDSE